VEVPEGARWLVISGQVGKDKQGRVGRDISVQSERALRNVLACLRAHGMSRKDLVKTTTYITDPRFVSDFRDARRKVLGDACTPTSTLVVVSALADPDLLVEVEAWAASA
jgi:enamine deaminase RidA (YjgF/YER057c/UK114 family)